MNLIRYFLVLVLVGAFFIASLSYRFIAETRITTVNLPERAARTRTESPDSVAISPVVTANNGVTAKHDSVTTHPRRLGGFATRSQEGTDAGDYSGTGAHGSNNCAWYKKPSSPKGPYFLTAVLLVRIYYADLAGLSSREMIQWLHYLKHAGIEHLYVYDAYILRNESQSRALAPYVREGFVTYVDWSHRANPYSIDGTQLSAYQDCITRWGSESVWQTAIDIDEYPFCLTDQKPGFMTRYIKKFASLHPEVSEMTMQNYLFLGKPLPDKEEAFLFGKLWRRTRNRGNTLVKPVYKPAHISSAQVHHNALSQGQSMDAPDEQFRMNHYWGARLQNWGEDTPEILAITEEDRSMEPIVREIARCVDSKDDLYKKQWN